jgi:hypothetical protein
MHNDSNNFNKLHSIEDPWATCYIASVAQMQNADLVAAPDNEQTRRTFYKTNKKIEK